MLRACHDPETETRAGAQDQLSEQAVAVGSVCTGMPRNRGETPETIRRNTATLPRSPKCQANQAALVMGYNIDVNYISFGEG